MRKKIWPLLLNVEVIIREDDELEHHNSAMSTRSGSDGGKAGSNSFSNERTRSKTNTMSFDSKNWKISDETEWRSNLYFMLTS